MEKTMRKQKDHLMNTDELKLYTIGFTGKSAEEFFTLLKKVGIKQLPGYPAQNCPS